MRQVVTDILAEAREVFQPKPASTAWSGWQTQIYDVRSKIHMLKGRCGEAYKMVFEEWNRGAIRAMSNEAHDKWHVLVQYGVRELLYFLYRCLSDLLNRRFLQKAVAVMVG